MSSLGRDSDSIWSRIHRGITLASFYSQCGIDRDLKSIRLNKLVTYHGLVSEILTLKRLDHPRILRISKFERTVLVLWTLSADESFRGNVVVVLKAYPRREK